MRCLVMKPASLETGVLDEILSTNSLETVLTSEVGAGVDLVEVPQLDDIQCGIAVLPPESSNNGARTAIFVEIGIATARQIPILVIADPSEPPLPALGDLMIIRTTLDNESALDLHIGLFLVSIRLYGGQNLLKSPPLDITTPDPPLIIQGPPGIGRSHAVANIIDEYMKSGARVLVSPTRSEGRIAEILDELLTEQGAIVQREVLSDSGLGRIDIAFTHPQIRETVLVEVRDTEQSSIDSARRQLYQYVRRNNQSIGLLLFRGPNQESTPPVSPEFPLIWAMTVADFYEQISYQELGTFLRHTRNRLVHG
ncbi:hypothetical protein [Nocardia abscessus]|uniref:hypothetical protein n=1 Tax=Nocardia abscessus TaxID=120957 RepID=UPI002454B134|nr:hypothetical protein [Nocardia abscessus]